MFKTEAIPRHGSWLSLEATGNMPPAGAEARYHAQLAAPALAV
ncbi:hypothetical protein [Roseicella aquatilis]|nr:hypothetical protein [Roseicella aquatilis]